MKKQIIKTLFLGLASILFLSGCGEKDLKTQKKECREAKKKFSIKKVLNIRTGEYILKGECK